MLGEFYLFVLLSYRGWNTMNDIELCTYEELENLQNNLKKDFCKKCELNTWHLKVGWKGCIRCMKCGEEYYE